MSRRRRRLMAKGSVSFLGVGVLSPQLTFSGGANAWYFNSSGLLTASSTNSPRFDYDPLTLAYKGLRMEGARTASGLHCRDFTQAAWTKSNVTAAKDAIGLDGVSNSCSTLTSTSSDGTALQSVTLGSAAYTFSVYVKRKTGAGTISITDNNGSNYTDITALINSSTFTKVEITRTQANPNFGFKISTSGDAIIVDVAQLENGAFSSSPIITTSAAVTRTADACSTSVSGKAWFNALEGTMFVDYQRDSTVSTATIAMRVDDGTDANNIRVYQETSASTRAFTARVDTASANQVAISRSSGNLNIACKSAFAYKVNDFALSANNSAVTTDTSGTVPTGITTLRIGSGVGSGHLFGCVKSAKYYGSRISDAQLVTMTL